jgi:hypothetical protein
LFGPTCLFLHAENAFIDGHTESHSVGRSASFWRKPDFSGTDYGLRTMSVTVTMEEERYKFHWIYSSKVPPLMKL